jgi:diamine N-acetyltransferase
MSSSIIIQRATEADADLIASLSSQTFYDTFHEQNSAEDMRLFLEQNFTAEKVLHELASPSNTFILAYQMDKAIGYAKLSDEHKPAELAHLNALEISRLYVVKEGIGLGIGKLLMEHCIWIASTMEKQGLWLGVWEHNQRAIQFYSKFGFEKFGEHLFMLGNDAQTDWLMKKALP